MAIKISPPSGNLRGFPCGQHVVGHAARVERSVRALIDAENG